MAYIEDINDVLNMDVDGTPLRKMLKDLLTMVIMQGESFDSKRPWGDGGWEFDIYLAMVQNGFVDGKIEDFMLWEVDTTKCDEILIRCIEEIFDK